MRKRLRFAIPLLLVAALATWYFTRTDGGERDGLFASGTIEATTADLGFQVPGRIASITVDEGSSVEEGDTLGRLDARELTASVEAARAERVFAEVTLEELLTGARPQEMASAEAALRSAARRATNAEEDLERARTLFAGGAISRQALDQAETGLEVAEAAADQAREQLALVREGPRHETISAQRARVERARANVARAEATLENAVVVAPFAGLVSVRHRTLGEVVPGGAPIVTLLDPADRWVRIYVREDAVGRVRIGQGARISSDSYPERRYDGEVVFIGSEAEFTPRNVQTTEERTRLVYPVKVRITGDPDFDLKPGVPADVTLDASPG